MTLEIAAFITGTLTAFAMGYPDDHSRSTGQKLAFSALPGLIAASVVDLLT
jgi:hypothetical protein